MARRSARAAPHDDVTLFRRALNASGLSTRKFGTLVLGTDERTARRWKQGDQKLPGSVRALCILYANGDVTLAAQHRLLEANAK